MTFTVESSEEIGYDWNAIQTINKILDRLRARRVSRVNPIGILLKSKAAWKISVLEQTFLYRTVMLADACTSSWNSKNTLGSILAARAIMETTAVLYDFRCRLSELIAKKDIDGIDRLTMNRTFSTRLDKWIDDANFVSAVNVLNFIDRLGVEFELVRHHYNVLSEFCHPNYLGHFMIFSDLDPETGVVSLSEGKGFNKGIFHHIFAAFVLIGVVEASLDKIEELIPVIVHLQTSGD